MNGYRLYSITIYTLKRWRNVLVSKVNSLYGVTDDVSSKTQSDPPDFYMEKV